MRRSLVRGLATIAKENVQTLGPGQPSIVAMTSLGDWEGLNAAQLEEKWGMTLHQTAKEGGAPIGGVLNGEQYLKLYGRMKEFNQFVVPMVKEEGFYNVVIAGGFPAAEPFAHNPFGLHFYVMDEFRALQGQGDEMALAKAALLRTVFYTDFVDAVDRVLVHGEARSADRVDKGDDGEPIVETIDAVEAQYLMNAWQLFYNQDDNFKLVQKMHQDPENFVYDEVLDVLGAATAKLEDQ